MTAVTPALVKRRYNKQGERITPFAFFHQTGCIADAGDIAADGFDVEAVEIDATKDDARAGRRRENAQAHRSAAVQADPGTLGGLTNCLLVSQP